MQGGIVVPATGPEASPPVQENDRPAWLPGNFKTPEDLVKSYQMLQSEYTKMRQGSTPQATGETPQAVSEPVKQNDLTIDKKAAEAVAGAGLDFDSLADEFMSQGKLSEASYKALAEKAGLPKHLVDDYIALKQSEASNIKNEVLQIAGGEEGFQQMIQWAATSYADAEAYNKMVTSGDPAQMRMAMTALKTAYTTANGQDPTLVMGSGGTGVGDVYADDLEMVADMQKPEYYKDPAFRRQVQEKVARTMGVKL